MGNTTSAGLVNLTSKQTNFYYELRVRYAEADSQGIVFNAHYLTYFDTAITEYVRHIGYDYQALVSHQGLDFHVMKSTIEYLAPVYFDDEIKIGVSPAKIGNSSLTWGLSVYRKGQSECLTRGEIIWVCAKVNEHKSHPIPQDFKDVVLAFEKQT